MEGVGVVISFGNAFNNAEFAVTSGGVSQVIEHIAQGIRFRIVAVADPDLIHFADRRDPVHISVVAAFDLAAEIASGIWFAIVRMFASGDLSDDPGEFIAGPVSRSVYQKAVRHPSGSAGVFQTGDQIGTAFQIFSIQAH